MTSTNDEREDLRECPFCGGDAHWCPTYIDRDTPGTVECANGCGATVICYGPKAERIAAWNNRSLPAPAPAQETAAPCKHCGKGPQAYTHESFDDSEHKYEPQAPATGGDRDVIAEVLYQSRPAVAWKTIRAKTTNHAVPWAEASDDQKADAYEETDAILAALSNHSPAAGGVGDRVKYANNAAEVEAVQQMIEQGRCYVDSEGYLTPVGGEVPAIVAWLRTMIGSGKLYHPGQIADAIERGYHVTALNPADAEGGE